MLYAKIYFYRLLPQSMKAEESMEDYFGNGFCGNLQHKLWNLLENPNSSFAAKVFMTLIGLVLKLITYVLSEDISRVMSCHSRSQSKHLRDKFFILDLLFSCRLWQLYLVYLSLRQHYHSSSQRYQCFKW